jgi:hypothetical protein
MTMAWIRSAGMVLLRWMSQLHMKDARVANSCPLKVPFHCSSSYYTT